MRTILLLAAALSAGFAWAGTLDGIAAKVGTDAITVGDVMAEIRRHPEAKDRVGSANETELQELYRSALDNLIDRKLILRAAAARKLDMQEWIVDNRVREIVHDSFGGDPNRLAAELAAAKIQMTDWRNRIREDMIVNAMRYQMVDNLVHVSPADLAKEYRDHPDRYVADEKADVRVILLKPSDDGKTPSVDTRADEILERLGKGADFAELAKKHSADSHAKDGGLWADVTPDDVFRAEIVEVLGKLKPGEHSQLVNLDGWGFIVRKEKQTAARRRTFREAYDGVAANVKKEFARTAYEAWMARLRADAFVKTYPAPVE